MATQNAINNLLATTSLNGYIQASNFPALTGAVTTAGGSLATTLAANAVGTSNIATSAVTYAKIQNMSANTLLGNPTGSGAAPEEITLGAGLSFSGTTLVASGGYAPLPITVVTGTTQSATVNNSYIANNAALVTVTLPSTAAIGSVINVGGLGAGGWQLAQNSGQTIHFGNVATTSGVSGYIASQNQYDNVSIQCVVANTTWVVFASQGNMTVN